MKHEYEGDATDKEFSMFVYKYRNMRGRVLDAFTIYDDLSEQLGKEPSLNQFQNVIQVLQKDYGCRISAADDLMKVKYSDPTGNKKQQISYFHIKDKELILRYQDKGDVDALAEFIRRNMGLIYKESQKYRGLAISLEEDDIKQLGVIGMIKGIKKFDLSMDNSISTYLCYWIKQVIHRGIQDEGYLIRLPAHMHETLSKINKCEMQRVIFELDEMFVANHINISLARYRELRNMCERYLSHASLYAPVSGEGEGGDSEVVDFIPGREEYEPEKQVMAMFMHESLEQVLETVTPREEKVLRLRFGLDDGRQRTLDEVGMYFGVTRERIRQIEAKALLKLRHPSRSRKIKDFFEG